MRRAATVLVGVAIGGVLALGIAAAQDAPLEPEVAAGTFECDGWALTANFTQTKGAKTADKALTDMLKDSGADGPYTVTSETATEVKATAGDPLGPITLSVVLHDGEWWAGSYNQCQEGA